MILIDCRYLKIVQNVMRRPRLASWYIYNLTVTVTGHVTEAGNAAALTVTVPQAVATVTIIRHSSVV
eukprot:g68713.t1